MDHATRFIANVLLDHIHAIELHVALRRKLQKFQAEEEIEIIDWKILPESVSRTLGSTYYTGVSVPAAQATRQALFRWEVVNALLNSDDKATHINPLVLSALLERLDSEGDIGTMIVIFDL
ncbi:hypothetical protein DXG01_000808 [Tephrocybe rancida]|nr:hypothetical protein DXG01_000808 [Tephrocybe rancida]